MAFVAAGPDQQAGMIPDPIDRANDIVDKDMRLQRPVGRALESAIGITCDPEILPN